MVIFEWIITLWVHASVVRSRPTHQMKRQSLFERYLKRWLPTSVRRHPLVQSLRLVWHNWRRWLAIWLAGQPALGQPQVCYGHEHIPRADEVAHGGIVKFQRLQPILPNAPHRFNILYTVSSSRPRDWQQLLWLAQRKQAKLVLNQNGVAYPAWHGPGWEQANQPMRQMLQAADYVFYQSQFCKLSADHFLGEPPANWEILYNAVDTTRFQPARTDPDPQHLVLLLGGNQYQFYRLERALKTLALVAQERAAVRLLVTGRLMWQPNEQAAAQHTWHLIDELGITDKVRFLGRYTQQEAPTLLQQAHILLHTKYNDPCPGLVVEAMAAGLPVAYSASGGTPELVGNEAGVGVAAPLSWEADQPPDPEAMAQAVLRIAAQRQHYAAAARQRAVEHFDLQPWVQRHHEVFERLLAL